MVCRLIFEAQIRQPKQKQKSDIFEEEKKRFFFYKWNIPSEWMIRTQWVLQKLQQFLKIQSEGKKLQSAEKLRLISHDL